MYFPSILISLFTVANRDSYRSATCSGGSQAVTDLSLQSEDLVPGHEYMKLSHWESLYWQRTSHCHLSIYWISKCSSRQSSRPLAFLFFILLSSLFQCLALPSTKFCITGWQYLHLKSVLALWIRFVPLFKINRINDLRTFVSRREGTGKRRILAVLGAMIRPESGHSIFSCRQTSAARLLRQLGHKNISRWCLCGPTAGTGHWP